MKRFLALLITGLLIGASCEAPRDRDAATRVSMEVVAPATLDQLSWMIGYWSGDEEGTRSEELWLPRRADVMLGLHVDLFPSGRSFFEYLRIEQRGTSVVYLASPRGRPATSFIATSVRDSSVVFENSQHDYPQKIEYRLDSSGRLHARVSGEENGIEESSEWVWGRSELPNP